MINYQHIHIKNLDTNTIDTLYKELLSKKWSFLIIETKNEKYCLTKEKSIFKIANEESFIKERNQDTFYKTIFNNNKKEDLIKREDLKIYYEYLDKYKNEMSKTMYGDKYLFGSVAVRTKDNHFITTIRGKENLLEYTVVKNIDYQTHTIQVVDKKATLNAPLLSKLFENDKVKVIVHINHYFDEALPYYEYAFPGTTKDSIRPNNTSFNIRYHGVIYLFDSSGNIL